MKQLTRTISVSDYDVIYKENGKSGIMTVPMVNCVSRKDAEEYCKIKIEGEIVAVLEVPNTKKYIKVAVPMQWLIYNAMEKSGEPGFCARSLAYNVESQSDMLEGSEVE